ncbi:Clavaminate synthase-like protein [Zalerion maritima]|uniref:Clavaminate synthase-like protein n=1 Tax=Zalerion maritima TaxID=339359 RepID=A0AAD5RJU6_9PEZI|nr:Clavaminate synthase-like protein [Zalerion maritima]
MADAAVKAEGLTIPLIDFGKFLCGTADDKKETANQVLNGFQNAGFIYLKNTPITPSFRSHVFNTSAKFFKLPMDEKMSHAWTTPEANRGYSAPGREKVSVLKAITDVTQLRSSNPDLKETFEIGREGQEDMPNHWPKEEGETSGFKPTMLEFFSQCKALHVEVMRAIAVGMGIDEKYFDNFVDVGDNTLRLLHYPSVKKEVFKSNPGQVRAGEHTDYGSITLLFQDGRGGLQVKSPSGEFINATPIENTVVVNAGDLLARWSNDTINSTLHRVVEPPNGDVEEYPARYSIAYFCNPNTKAYIEAIPGTFAAEEEKKYSGINSGDYLVQRLTATY